MKKSPKPLKETQKQRKEKERKEERERRKHSFPVGRKRKNRIIFSPCGKLGDLQREKNLLVLWRRVEERNGLIRRNRGRTVNGSIK